MADPTKILGSNAVRPIIPENPAVQKPDTRAKEAGKAAKDSSNPSFAELLRVQQGIAGNVSPAAQGRTSPNPAGAAPNALRFSAHAQTRMQSRQIALGEGQMNRLNGAVQRAANKGSRDALVLMDDLAMVVSVSNRTVVTVVDKDNLKQNVFTNIDSAVIA